MAIRTVDKSKYIARDNSKIEGDLVRISSTTAALYADESGRVYLGNINPAASQSGSGKFLISPLDNLQSHIGFRIATGDFGVTAASELSEVGAGPFPSIPSDLSRDAIVQASQSESFFNRIFDPRTGGFVNYPTTSGGIGNSPGGTFTQPDPNQPTPTGPSRPVPINPLPTPTPTTPFPPGGAATPIDFGPPGSTPFPLPPGSGFLVRPDGQIEVFDQSGVSRGVMSPAQARGFFQDVGDFFTEDIPDFFGGTGLDLLTGGALGGVQGAFASLFASPLQFFDDIAGAFDPFANQDDIEDALKNARDELIRGASFAGDTERQSIATAAQRQREGTVAAGNEEQGALQGARDVLRGQFDLQGRTLNPVSQLGLASQEELAARPETAISAGQTFTPGTAPVQFAADPDSGLDFNAATRRGETFARDPNLGRTFDPRTRTGETFAPPTDFGQAFTAPTASGRAFTPQVDFGQTFQRPTASGQRFVAPTASGQRFTAATDAGQRFTAPTASGQRFAPQTDFGQTFDAPTVSGERFDPATQFSFTRDDLAEDEGFQFRLEQGQQAIDRSAAARGGLVSGRTLAAAQEFGQGLAATEFDAAFRRASQTFADNFGREAAVFDRNAQEFQNQFQRQAQQFGINAQEFMNKFTRDDRVFSQNEQQFADEFQRSAQRFGINADEFANVFNREAQRFAIGEQQFGQEFARGAQRFGIQEQQFADQFQRDAQAFGINADEFAAKFARGDRAFTQQEQQFADQFARTAQQFGVNADEFARNFGRQQAVFEAGERQLGEEFGREQAAFGVNADLFGQDFARDLQGFQAREQAFNQDFARAAEAFDRNAAEFGATFARRTAAHDRLQEANELDFARQLEAFNTNDTSTLRRDALRLDAAQQRIDALATSAQLGQSSRNLLAQLDAELSLNLSEAEAAPGLAAAANILRQAEINSQEVLGLGLSASQQDIALANARATAENAIAQARADMQSRHSQLVGTVLGAALGFGFQAIT